MAICSHSHISLRFPNPCCPVFGTPHLPNLPTTCAFCSVIHSHCLWSATQQWQKHCIIGICRAKTCQQHTHPPQQGKNQCRKPASALRDVENLLGGELHNSNSQRSTHQRNIAAALAGCPQPHFPLHLLSAALGCCMPASPPAQHPDVEVNSVGRVARKRRPPLSVPRAPGMLQSFSTTASSPQAQQH